MKVNTFGSEEADLRWKTSMADIALGRGPSKNDARISKPSQSILCERLTVSCKVFFFKY